MSPRAAASRVWRLPALPPYARGLRIGLLGGSFNPAHAGHRQASLTALRRLRLDRVWWLVSPGNPLKDLSNLPDMDARLSRARRVAADPRISVTGFEADIGARFTADVITYLRRRCPGVRFVWLMGADNLAEFHRWRRFGDIAARVPIAVIDRPGSTHKALRAPAAVRFGRYRRDARDAQRLSEVRPPAWIMLHGRRSNLSSTFIRQDGAKSTKAR